jgi:hypothetical protein
MINLPATTGKGKKKMTTLIETAVQIVTTHPVQSVELLGVAVVAIYSVAALKLAGIVLGGGR